MDRDFGLGKCLIGNTACGVVGEIGVVVDPILGFGFAWLRKTIREEVEVTFDENGEWNVDVARSVCFVDL